jgi:hypothetical protein
MQLISKPPPAAQYFQVLALIAPIRKSKNQVWKFHPWVAKRANRQESTIDRERQTKPRRGSERNSEWKEQKANMQHE